MKLDLNFLLKMIDEQNKSLENKTPVLKENKGTTLDLQGLFSLFEEIEPTLSHIKEEEESYSGGTKVVTLQDINIVGPKIRISDRLAKSELKDSQYFAKIMNSLGGERTPDGVFNQIRSIKEKLNNNEAISSQQAISFQVLLEAFYSLFNSFGSIGGIGVGWLTEAFATGMYQGELIQAGEGNARNIAADVILPDNTPVSIKARMLDKPGDLGSRKNIANTIHKYGYIYFDLFLKEKGESASRGITKIIYQRLKVDKQTLPTFDSEYQKYESQYSEIFAKNKDDIENFIEIPGEVEVDDETSETHNINENGEQEGNNASTDIAIQDNIMIMYWLASVLYGDGEKDLDGYFKAFKDQFYEIKNGDEKKVKDDYKQEGRTGIPNYWFGFQTHKKNIAKELGYVGTSTMHRLLAPMGLNEPNPPENTTEQEPIEEGSRAFQVPEDKEQREKFLQDVKGVHNQYMGALEKLKNNLLITTPANIAELYKSYKNNPGEKLQQLVGQKLITGEGGINTGRITANEVAKFTEKIEQKYGELISILKQKNHLPSEYEAYVNTKVTRRIQLSPAQKERQRLLKEIGSLKKMGFPEDTSIYQVAEPIVLELKPEEVEKLTEQTLVSINKSFQDISRFLTEYTQAINGYFLSEENNDERSANAQKALETSERIFDITSKATEKDLPPKQEV